MRYVADQGKSMGSPLAPLSERGEPDKEERGWLLGTMKLSSQYAEGVGVALSTIQRKAP